MKSEDKITNIFISYSWANAVVADQIEKDLNQLQIAIQRDVRDLKYKSSIPDFMSQIRDTDFAIVLISEEYLKSKNCMIEVLHLLKEREYEDKILPVIVGEPDIYNPEGRLKYTNYWEEKRTTLEKIISGHSPETVIAEISELKTIISIYSEVNQFANYISNLKNLTFEELKKEGYKSLLDAIGFEDVSHLVSLLLISFVHDTSKKEILIDEWFEKNSPTSDAYSIRASLANEQGNFEKAKINYQKALGLNSNNAFAMNNYAFMLMCLKEHPDLARKLLVDAISIMPNLTEARLNLGCLLTDKFNDPAEAKRQYNEIILYNPTEERAYNNLANIYKRENLGDKNNSKLVCDLYKKAIELNPKYIEARLGYSNYLSDILGKYFEARYQLDEIVKIDPKAQALTDTFNTHIDDLIRKKIDKMKLGRNDKCPCGSGLKFKHCHMN